MAAAEHFLFCSAFGDANDASFGRTYLVLEPSYKFSTGAEINALKFPDFAESLGDGRHLRADFKKRLFARNPL